MLRYRYEARDAEGVKVKGWAEAANEEALINKLHKQELRVISITGGGKRFEIKRILNSILARDINIFRNRVRTDTLLVFASQLSAMLTAGIPLLRVLRGLASETPSRRLKDIIERVGEDVNAGINFSDAIERYPSVFRPLFVYLVRAGEISGKLNLTLAQLVDYLESTASTRGKLKAALVYPIIITVFSILVMLVLMIEIIPRFKDIYQGLGAELPLPTKILLSTCNAIQHHFVMGFILVIGILVLFSILVKTEKGLRLFDHCKLKIPVLGTLFKKNILSTFSKTMSVLLSSQIPVIQAIRMSSKIINNKIMEKALLNTADRIENGGGIAESFGQEDLFPEILIQMIASGEETGTLDEMIGKVADFYDRQVDSFTTAITTLIEPIFIIVIGTVVGGIVISMFLPMFKIGGLIR